MPFDAGQTPILYDWSGAPVASGYAPITSRIGQALNTTAQGGMVMLGGDYGTSAKGQIPKVDANGTLYVTPTSPTGTGSTMVYTGQASTAAALQYGTLSFLRQDTPTPSNYQPLTADMNGNLCVHPRSKMTMRAVIRQIPTAANKYLAVITNASTSTVVLRLYEVRVYVTPAGTGSNLLGLGSGTTYYPMFAELYRVAAANVSAGSTITPVSVDTADTINSGVTVLSAPTVSTYTASLFRSDVVLANAIGQNFYERRDPNEKSLVIRPGEGIALICLSNGTVTNSSGGTTANAPVDIQFVFTQAVA